MSYVTSTTKRALRSRHSSAGQRARPPKVGPAPFHDPLSSSLTPSLRPGSGNRIVEHEVLCSRDMTAVRAPQLMSMLCRGKAEVEAMLNLFDLLGGESVAGSLEAGQTVSREGVFYLFMAAVDSAARQALEMVVAMASATSLPRDARLLPVERFDRAEAEGRRSGRRCRRRTLGDHRALSSSDGGGAQGAIRRSSSSSRMRISSISDMLRASRLPGDGGDGETRTSDAARRLAPGSFMILEQQCVGDAGPDASALLPAKMVVDGLPRREVVQQQSPRAACAQQVEDGAAHFGLASLAGAAFAANVRDRGREAGPFRSDRRHRCGGRATRRSRFEVADP